MHAPFPPYRRSPAARHTFGPAASAALASLLLAFFFAASSAPTPLYALYREAWGFSPARLTVVFAVYAFALLAALLVTGALSEHAGRRPVIVGAVALEALSMAVFAVAPSVDALMVARVIQGFATGVAASALSATVIDHAPGRGAWLNSMVPGLGLGAGALGASLLVQFAPAPTRLVYWLLLAVFAVLGLAVLRLRETASLRPGGWASLRPRVQLPPQVRGAFWSVAPVEVAVWALGALYLSLGPSLVRSVSGSLSPVEGGLLVAALTFSGVLATLALGRQATAVLVRYGATALALGTAISLAGLHAGSVAVFFAGVVVAGTGFGAGFLGALRTVLAPAAAHERAGVLAAFYILSYLANSLPAIGAGVAAGRFGLTATANGYGAILIVLCAASLWLSARRA
ncbi:MFS transporter [Xylophilus sp.]|uniref:MFS transporter n=1 Tax=Xylophilus sp. TaxID=2653893 RepID=UPI0013BE1EEF|nr:MFS transporter [Xylophilus sp.]KAF1045721.1 MAG: Multidrug resistance protein MdtL [Xylophilus sp.]